MLINITFILYIDLTFRFLFIRLFISLYLSSFCESIIYFTSQKNVAQTESKRRPRKRKTRRSNKKKKFKGNIPKPTSKKKAEKKIENARLVNVRIVFKWHLKFLSFGFRFCCDATFISICFVCVFRRTLRMASNKVASKKRCIDWARLKVALGKSWTLRSKVTWITSVLIVRSDWNLQEM